MNNASDNMNINYAAHPQFGAPVAPPYGMPHPGNGFVGYGAYQMPQMRQPYNAYAPAPQQPFTGYGAYQPPARPVYNAYQPQGYGYQPQGYGYQPYGAPGQYMPPYGIGPAYPTPASIYYNSQTGAAPQYHYGTPTMGGVIHNKYFVEQSQRAEARTKLKKRIRVLGNLIGGASLLTNGFGTVLVYLIEIIALIAGPDSGFAQIYNALWNTVTGSSLLQVLYTLTAVGGAFWVFRKLISRATTNDINTPLSKNKKSKCVRMPLGAPKGGAKVPLLIMIGFGGCILTNYVCIFISMFYSMIGLGSTGSSGGPVPQNAWDIAALFFSTAIVPALIEELALRGITMTPLRKYGDGFAILFSAFIFGIFHGTLEQIPFAFACGLFMGYAVVMTESLWTGVIIHALNNSISVIQAAIMMEHGEDAAGTFFLLLSAVVILAGGGCLAIYLVKYRKEDIPKLKSKTTLVKTSGLFGAAISSPATIVAIVYFVLTAIGNRLLENMMA